MFKNILILSILGLGVISCQTSKKDTSEKEDQKRNVLEGSNYNPLPNTETQEKIRRMAIKIQALVRGKQVRDLLKTYQFTIPTLDGNEIEVEARGNETIRDLKQKISQHSPHDSKNQQIYSEDSEEELPDNTRLFPTVVNKKIFLVIKENKMQIGD